MIEKIDHIGIAVKSLAEAIPFYEKALGLKCEKIEEVPSQKVRTAFFSVGGIHLELLEPTEPGSNLAVFLEKRGPGIHHLGFQTDNVVTQLNLARQNGCGLINEKPVPGAGGKEVAFLHPRSTLGVLVEFCSGCADQKN
jgi:methylmalonyl-CoA/ethylmalonyl-CoA epimerase